ncbi:phage holin family protein [Paenibacillus sp. ACRRX]|uniref:phage holin family protein n=1 Tax=Paenibacillus sp. ACRRX TaxID=2918206 RepID=UPI001EF45F72|nr:phage holin family protein [Paenibacillus sp. ACRRX]MCG7406370.1 phage holin family protein [Paenibacillus sp. ACRRX]
MTDLVYLKELTLSTAKYSFKMFSDYTFYVGGIVGGWIFYFTGLSVVQLQSILLIIFLDVATRVWAELRNNRSILSRKLFSGFFGKFTSYMVLFTLAQHSFYLQDLFQYAILGGFSLVEFRSIYENLKDAGQKHITLIGDRIEQELNRGNSQK